MAKALDLVGHKYNRLTVVSPAAKQGKIYYWNCLCDCGKTTIVCTSNVRHGQVKSCGCLNKELHDARNITHGKTNTPEYIIWSAMKQRCLYEKGHKWVNYGGRGITICERWLCFSNFYEDMGPRPSNKHSLDRINNDGNYEPSNCRWATNTEQCNNRAPKGTYTAAKEARIKEQCAQFWKSKGLQQFIPIKHASLS